MGGLGWGSYITDIVRILGNGGSAGRGERDFAKTVRIWQQCQRFAHLAPDGIVGENTWRVIQSLLNEIEAIIIVPTEGHGTEQFVSVARSLRRDIYHGRAKILKAKVTEIGFTPSPGNGVVYCNRTTQVNNHQITVRCPVKLHNDDGGLNWPDFRNLRTIITISHGGSDGPNLKSHMGGHQPWNRHEERWRELSEPGRLHWSAAGFQLADDGKIIFLGCSMGRADRSYAKLVATAARKKTYAATGSFAAANVATSLTHVRQIENGAPRSPMHEYTP